MKTRYKEIFIDFFIIFLISIFALRSIFSDYYYFIFGDYTETIGETWNLYLNLNNGSFSIWLDKFMYPSYPIYKITLALLAYFLNGNIILATKYYMFFIFFLSGISMYIAGRVIIKNRFGALIASIGYIFSYFILSELVSSHWNIEFITLPITFGAFYLLVNNEFKNRYFFAMVLGMSASALYYETGYQLMIFLFISAIIYSFFKKDWRPVSYTIFSIILALLITAPITLPMIDNFTKKDVRFLAYDEQMSAVKRFSIPFDTLFPDIERYLNIHTNPPEMHGTYGIISDTPYPSYALSYSLIFLAFLYIIYIYSKLKIEDKEISLILFFSFILFLLISQGSYLRWFYDLLYSYLPFFKSTRVPIRFLFISIFALSIIAGFGASTVNNSIKNKLKIFPILLFIIIFIDIYSSTGYLATFGVDKDNLLHEENGLKIYGTKWITRDPITEDNRPFRYFGIQDNFIMSSDNIQSITDIIKIYRSMESGKEFIAYPTDYYGAARLGGTGIYLHNRKMISKHPGSFTAKGYAPLSKSIFISFDTGNVTEIANKMLLMNAGYIIVHDWPILSKVGLTSQGMLIENLNRSPYFKEIIKGEYDYLFEYNNSLGNVWAGEIDENFDPLVDNSVEISNIKYNTGHITFNTYSQKSSSIIVNEPYYIGWKAYVNRNETNISNDKFFMKLPIGVGVNEVKLEYDKYSYKPYFISYLTFILLYFSIIYLIFRKTIILIIAIPVFMISIIGNNFISETIIALSQWISIILCMYITLYNHLELYDKDNEGMMT